MSADERLTSDEEILLLQSDPVAQAGLAHVDLTTRREIFEAFDAASGTWFE